MAWLSGWDKRVELKIEDYASKIGGAVTWFPVTVFLTAAQCEEVFVELTTDAEFPKVAFTKADGVTELYAECELFDVSEELGIYHVSRDGWTINANTSIYMYYDKDHADNNAFIGAITARTEVWDGNYLMVCHMVDDDGNVDDSTSNNADGTKKGAGEPAEAAGKIGQAQDFDGIDDYIDIPSLGTFGNTGFIEVWFKTDDLTAIRRMLYIGNDAVSHYVSLMIRATGLRAHYQYDGSYQCDFVDIAFSDTTNWHYFALAFADDDFAYFLDSGTPGDTDSSGTTANLSDTNQSWISTHDGSGQPWDGKVDEVRISSVRRANAWANGSLNSGNDALLTYGSEELFVIALASTAVITVGIVGVLSRGITEALISTSAITSSTTGRLIRIMHLASISVIVISITSALSRGIAEALTSTANIAVSTTASLSRGITAVLNSTVNITTSITSALSRGVAEALTSTVDIVLSITAILNVGYFKIAKSIATYTKIDKDISTYTKRRK